MGIANLLANKAHDRLKKCAEKEAAKTGTTIDHFERVRMSDTGAWGTVGKILVSRTATGKQLQIYHLRNGALRFLYVEPFDNAVQLPGEFHVRIPGGFSQPVLYRKDGWTTNEDQNLRARLDSSAELKSALKRLRWQKGHQVRVQLDWGLQIRALGDGTSHVVMQSGSYGLFTETPGIAVFLDIVKALEPLMLDAALPVQNLYFECQHGLFTSFVEAASA